MPRVESEVKEAMLKFGGCVAPRITNGEAQLVIIAKHEDGSILRITRAEDEVESTIQLMKECGYLLFVVHKA